MKPVTLYRRHTGILCCNCDEEKDGFVTVCTQFLFEFSTPDEWRELLKAASGPLEISGQCRFLRDGKAIGESFDSVRVHRTLGSPAGWSCLPPEELYLMSPAAGTGGWGDVDHLSYISTSWAGSFWMRWLSSPGSPLENPVKNTL